MISNLVRKAVNDLLINQILIGTYKVPVYNKVPSSAKKPLIEIVEQSSTQTSDKDVFQYACSLPIGVITSSIGGMGGDLQSEQIAQAVDLKLQPNPSTCNISILGYSIIIESVSSSTYSIQNGNEYNTHKILIYNLLITKNN